ncbi:NfeD family protein [Polyangium sp. y55x31]|uniref:NfeD family protein n=1 Tax=Polyangium sp. y55x31 TaxID=3042688 RepID=UPI00248231D7|nr:NfeD family protein [Polyangium sp. y55x31]
MLALWAMLLCAFARGQAARPIVHVAPIHAEIDGGRAPHVQRAVSEAEQAGATAFVLEPKARGRDLLAERGLSDAEIRTATPNWAEKLVWFSTSPVGGALLLGFGLMGLFVEIHTPGFGAPGILGLVCLTLFFWSHALLALVGWEELALVGGGIVLLLLEIFVIPGFGLAGVLGVAALLTGLGMSFVGPGATTADVIHAAAEVAAALVVTFVGAALLLRVLRRLPFGRSLVLEAGHPARALPFEGSPLDAILPGDLGTAASPLRPSGIAEITGARVDALSEGEYIPAGTPIEVLRVEQSYVVVRRAGEKEKG